MLTLFIIFINKNTKDIQTSILVFYVHLDTSGDRGNFAPVSAVVGGISQKKISSCFFFISMVFFNLRLEYA